MAARRFDGRCQPAAALGRYAALIQPRSRDAAPSALRFEPQVAHHLPTSGAFSPDGRVALSTGGNTVKLWDVASGRLARTIRSPYGGVAQATFSPDGERVYAAGAGGVSVWRARDGVQTEVVPSAVGASAVALDREGKRLVVAGFRGVEVWAIDAEGKASDAMACSLEDGPDGRELALSPSGRYAATGGHDDAVVVWDLDGRRVARVLRGHAQGVRALRFATEKALVSRDGEEVVRVWDAETGLLHRRFADPSLRTFAPSMHAEPDGRVFLRDGIYDANEDRFSPYRADDASFDDADFLAMSPDGTLKLTATRFGVADSKRPWLGRVFARSLSPLRGAAIDPGGEQIVFATHRAVGGWELNTLLPRGPMSSLDPEDWFSAHVDAVALSADGRQVLVAEGRFEQMPLLNGFSRSRTVGTLTLYDAINGRRLASVDRGEVENLVHDVVLSPSRDRAAVVAIDEVQIWDLPGARKLTSLELESGAEALAFSPDGREVVIAAGGATIRMAATGGDRVEVANKAASAAAYSPDGATLALGLPHEGAVLVDLRNGNRRTLSEVGHPTAMALANDGKTLAIGTWAGDIALVDTSTLEERSRQRAHAGEVVSVQFVRDSRTLVSASDDGVTRLTRLDTLASLNLLFASDDAWLVYTDDGYFDASRRGGDLIAVTRGDEVFTLGQHAARYNRPDLLLESMGLGDSESLAHFRARHARRLASLGLSADGLASLADAAPKATIATVTSGERRATVELWFEAPEPSRLARYFLFANGVPLSGPQGKPLAGRYARATETIELEPGRNEIEVSVVDARGAESGRASRMLDGGPGDKGALYFLGVGVSRYANPKYSLRFADKDARDLASALRLAKNWSSRGVHVKTLLNEEATAPGLRAARSFLEQARVGDTVVVLLAGHGLRARDDEGRFYFATHEIDPRDLERTALSLEAIEELFHSLPARKRLLLLDACESGDRDEQQEASLVAAAGARGMFPRAIPSAELIGAAAHAVARRRGSRFAELRARDRLIYEDLARGSGTVVLASSSGSELSYEFAALRNGAFTEALIGSLAAPAPAGERRPHDPGELDVHALAKSVAQAVARATGDRQHPQIYRGNELMRVALPRIGEVRGLAAADDAVRSTNAPAPPRITRGGCVCALARPRGTDWPSLAFAGALAATALRRGGARRGL